MVNTGGYRISDLSSVDGVGFATKLSGVQFTDTSATGKITLIAQSPLIIDAPINAGQGSVLLAASGSETTDDVTINSQITATSAEVFAGDSVDLGVTADIVASSTSVQIATNYVYNPDPVAVTTSTGSNTGSVNITNINDLPTNLTLSGPTIETFRTDSSGRVASTSSDVQSDYQNAQLRGVIEELQVWDNITVVGYLPTGSYLDTQVEPDNSGEVEIDKKK